jgi:hypothetical protein
LVLIRCETRRRAFDISEHKPPRRDDQDKVVQIFRMRDRRERRKRAALVSGWFVGRSWVFPNDRLETTAAGGDMYNRGCWMRSFVDTLTRTGYRGVSEFLKRTGAGTRNRGETLPANRSRSSDVKHEDQAHCKIIFALSPRSPTSHINCYCKWSIYRKF